MEDLTALSIACKHMNTDCRDDTYSKLRKQKHAAHSQNCRLKKKLAMLELANKLLTICWIRIVRENQSIRNQIEEYVEQARQIDETI